MVVTLTDAQAAVAAEIPGCARYGRGWKIPRDCFELLRLAPAATAPRVAWADAVAALKNHGTFSKLWPAQPDDLRFIFENDGAVIAHPTAAGKAVVGSSFARAVADLLGPVLIVCPALARGVWRAELAKWFSTASAKFNGTDLIAELQGLTPYEYRLPPNGLGGGFAPDTQVVVISQECFTPAWGRELMRTKWAGLILDEGHEFRGRRTRRCRGLRQALMFSRPIVTVLTATPQWGRVDSLYNVLDLVRPGEFGTYRQFSARYAGAVEGLYGGLVVGRATNVDELQTRLKHTVRRLTKAELRPNLPPLVRQVVPLVNEAAATRLARAATAVIAQLDVERRKGTAGAARDAMLKAMQRETKLKTKHLVELCAGADRVFIATQTHAGIDTAIEALRTVDGQVFRVDGTISVEKRIETIAAALAAPAPTFVVGTMQSVRQAIDCSGIDRVVVLELPPTGTELEQFEGRFHRHRGVEVWYVVIEHSIDQRHLQLCVEKLEDAAQTVGIDPLTHDLVDTLTQSDTRVWARRLEDVAGGADASLEDVQ